MPHRPLEHDVGNVLQQMEHLVSSLRKAIPLMSEESQDGAEWRLKALEARIADLRRDAARLADVIGIALMRKHQAKSENKKMLNGAEQPDQRPANNR